MFSQEGCCKQFTLLISCILWLVSSLRTERTNLRFLIQDTYKSATCVTGFAAFEQYLRIPKVTGAVTFEISSPKEPQLSGLSGSRYFRTVKVREQSIARTN